MPSGPWPKTRPGAVQAALVHVQIGSAALEVSGQRVGRLLGHSIIDVPNRHRTGSLDQYGCHLPKRYACTG